MLIGEATIYYMKNGNVYAVLDDSSLGYAFRHVSDRDWIKMGLSRHRKKVKTDQEGNNWVLIDEYKSDDFERSMVARLNEQVGCYHIRENKLIELY